LKMIRWSKHSAHHRGVHEGIVDINSLTRLFGLPPCSRDDTSISEARITPKDPLRLAFSAPWRASF
jgi:hypothetical protein